VASDSPEQASESPASVRPYSSTWVRYYDAASRRRHRNGGYRRLRKEARRRRQIEMVTFVAGGLSVLAIVGVCYLILSNT
jgi:hypothetical protein